jgi:hypothetical protein
MAFNRSALLVRSPDILSTDIDGELVLISIHHGRYYGLDAVGSEIWQRLEQPKLIDALCDEVKAHFEGDPDTIERETIEYIDLLASNALVLEAS